MNLTPREQALANRLLNGLEHINRRPDPLPCSTYNLVLTSSEIVTLQLALAAASELRTLKRACGHPALTSPIQAPSSTPDFTDPFPEGT